MSEPQINLEPKLAQKEIAEEVRELHAHFRQLYERYEQAPAGERAEIREQMQPLVNRERELRQEVTDRVPQQQIGFSR